LNTSIQMKSRQVHVRGRIACKGVHLMTSSPTAISTNVARPLTHVIPLRGIRVRHWLSCVPSAQMWVVLAAAHMPPPHPCGAASTLLCVSPTPKPNLRCDGAGGWRTYVRLCTSPSLRGPSRLTLPPRAQRQPASRRAPPCRSGRSKQGGCCAWGNECSLPDQAGAQGAEQLGC
jgi:hypothetical protein